MTHLRSLLTGSICGGIAVLLLWTFSSDPTIWILAGMTVAVLGLLFGMRNGACAAYAVLIGVVSMAATLALGGLAWASALLNFAAMALLFGAGWMFGYAWFMRRVEKRADE